MWAASKFPEIQEAKLNYYYLLPQELQLAALGNIYIYIYSYISSGL